MKARITKTEVGTYLLCSDGSVIKTTPSQLKMFFINFNKTTIFSGKTTGKENPWNTQYLDITDYPGETLAYVTDDNKLVINDPSILQDLLKRDDNVDYVPNLLTTQQYAKLHNRSQELIKAFVRTGRIIGAKKIGRIWLIPEDAPYPIEEKSQKPTAGRTANKKK